MKEEVDALWPSAMRIVAHPYDAKDMRPKTEDGMSLTLAIGPEGGWTDEEVALLEEHGFSRFCGLKGIYHGIAP